MTKIPAIPLPDGTPSDFMKEATISGVFREQAPDDDLQAYAQMAARLSDLDAQIEQLKEQRDQTAELLLSSLPEGAKKVEAGDYTISVRAGARRLNTRKVEEAFPAAQYPTMYQLKATLITEEVKRQVSEAFLEEHGLFIVGRPSVSVK